MPIPTRSHSVRTAGQPGPPESRIRVAALQQSIDGEAPRKTSSKTPGTTNLPQPRQVAGSGLPRIANGHARTQSASNLNVPQRSAANSAAPAAAQQTGGKAGVGSKSTTTASNPVVNLRAGHGRSQSTALGTTQRSRSGLKPAFSTYQQQVDPAKPRIDAQAAVNQVGTRSASGLDAATSHHTGIRDELLQLILVHAGSQGTLKQYAESAASKLDSRAARLRQEQAEVAILEQKRQEDVNSLGLINLLGQGSEDTFLERVRSVSLAIQQLTELGSEAGEFYCVIQQFEVWQASAQNCLTRQNQNREGAFVERCPVNELPFAWSQAVQVLSDRITFYDQSLCEVGDLDEGCALERIVYGHRRLAGFMLGELELCTELYSSFMAHQQQQTARSLAQILSESREGGNEAETGSRKPLWETRSTNGGISHSDVGNNVRHEVSRP